MLMKSVSSIPIQAAIGGYTDHFVDKSPCYVPGFRDWVVLQRTYALWSFVMFLLFLYSLVTLRQYCPKTVIDKNIYHTVVKTQWLDGSGTSYTFSGGFRKHFGYWMVLGIDSINWSSIIASASQDFPVGHWFPIDPYSHILFSKLPPRRAPGTAWFFRANLVWPSPQRLKSFQGQSACPCRSQCLPMPLHLGCIFFPFVLCTLGHMSPYRWCHYRIYRWLFIFVPTCNTYDFFWWSPYVKVIWHALQVLWYVISQQIWSSRLIGCTVVLDI